MIEGDAKRVTILCGESDRAGHSTLYEAIVRLLHDQGCAGATVIKGLMGFGKTSRIHSANILDLSGDLPVCVLWIDTPEQVERVLPQVEELLGGGVVIVDDVHVRRYSEGV